MNLVDRRSGRHAGLDGIEEADELLVSMALHVTTDGSAVEDVEGSKQRRRAVTLVVVGHRPGAARLHGQARLSAVECLDLALLVDGEDDGMSGWIDVETDDVAQLGDEPRISGELELLDPVRLKAVRAPDAVDGTGADVDGLRHHGSGPVGRFGGRLGLAERDDALGGIRSQGWDARRPRLVAQQPVVAFLHEAFLPAPDAGLGLAGPAHDLIGANTVCTQQHDLCPPYVLVGGVAVPCQRLEATPASRLESDGNSSSHATNSHTPQPVGIHSGIQMSDAIH